MGVTTFERSASILEMAVEMDRRGDVIEKLEAEIERLRKALAPFAQVARGFRSSEPDSVTIECTLGECRRAREAFARAA